MEKRVKILLEKKTIILILKQKKNYNKRNNKKPKRKQKRKKRMKFKETKGEKKPGLMYNLYTGVHSSMYTA